MTRSQYTFALLVLAVAGCLGGMVFSWIASPQVAFAQQRLIRRLPVQKVIRAEKFELVDRKGNVCAQLVAQGMHRGAPELTLFSIDHNGKAEPSIILSVGEGGAPSLVFKNKAISHAYGQKACPQSVVAAIKPDTDGSMKIILWDGKKKNLWRAP